MHISFENVSAYIAIIVFFAGAIRYSVIRPIDDTIKELSRAVDDLRDVVKDIDRRIDTLSERLTATEHNVKAAHKRIDEINERLR